MHAPVLPRTSNSSKTTPRTTAPTCAANTAGSAAIGKSPSGCFRACRMSQDARSTNPISGISRWKIFDNLRRSLVEPSHLRPLYRGLAPPAGRTALLDHRFARSCCSSRLSLNLHLRLAGRSQADADGQVREAFARFSARDSCGSDPSCLSCRTKLCSPSMPSFARWSGDSSPASACWNGRPPLKPNCHRRPNAPVDRYLALTPLVGR